MPEIEPRSETPVYRQIAAILRRDIEQGKFRPRLPLPSEMHLVQRFGVARDTVRRGLAHLAELGLVRTIPGRGTYVRALETTVNPLERGTRVLSRPATPAERDLLEMPEGDWVLVIEHPDGEVEILPAAASEVRVQE